MTTLAFLNIGTQEMVLIMIVALLLFGGKKLPELARGLGRGIREFKDASEDIKREISDQINNFEKEVKDLDVIVEDKPKSSTDNHTVHVPQEVLDAEEAVAKENGELVNNVDQPEEEAKKYPQFTAPEGTYQHNPGGHPADDSDYYKYGYNDYFESEEVKESQPDDVLVNNPVETDKGTSEESKQA